MRSYSDCGLNIGAIFFDELELHSSRGLVTGAYRKLARMHVLGLLMGPLRARPSPAKQQGL